MPNKMLIDATHPEETRVVVLRGSRVEEFDFESASRRQLRGNIYLAKVTRVEPSLQAAFIDYGGNRHGFLAFSEIHPDYYQIPVADRQALIDEEERAHRAADAEADRRAAARTAARTVPAGRGSHRQNSVASKPVADAEPPVEGETVAPGDAALAAVEELPSFEETDEFQKRVIEDFAPDEANPAEGGPASAGDAPPDAEAESSIGESADVAAATEAATEPLDARIGADLAEMLSPPAADNASVAEQAEAAEIEPGSPAGDEPAGSLAGEAEIPAGASVAPDGEQETAAENAHDPGDETEMVASTHAAVGDDDEDDDDDEDEDEDEDEEDEAAEAEEGVEMVGGADALEEAQERTPRVRRQYKIQEVIKRRQIMLVQVVKEERGTKGAALTTYLSLAGRYSVLMPNTARGGGISRKITNPQDRNRLKEIAQDLEVPEGMGVILRTAGAARTKTEIKRDFEYLLRMWEQVRDMTLKSTAPTLVYEEGSVVKRAIRDLYSKDIDEVVVAGEEAFREAKDFMRMLMPSHAKNVKHYNENLPLLIRYNAESQLDAMFSPIVQLRSGGYIVLNQTEALVAIDVNSGRATREHHIEDTALKTNLEAAEEIARQLRLRDLAGLIVIDFIDMDEKRNNRAVERRLKECLKNDRARIQVGRISHFGLLEMSRQRLRTSVFESSTEKCPHCGGTGHVRSVASVSLQCVRMLEELLLRGATHNIVVRTGAEIAFYMLNQKRAHLRDLEQRFRITITVKADGTPGGPHPFVIEKGDQVHSLEQARALAVQPPAVLAPPAVPEDDEVEVDAEMDGDDIAVARDEELSEDAERGDAGDNGGRRRRRRRRRGGRRGEERAEAGAAARDAELDNGDGEEAESRETEQELAAAGGSEPNEAEDGTEAGESAEQRRRRRRGRRGGRRNRRAEDEGSGAAATAAEGGEAAGPDGIGIEVESGERTRDVSGPASELADAEEGETGSFTGSSNEDGGLGSAAFAVVAAPGFLPASPPAMDAESAAQEPDMVVPIDDTMPSATESEAPTVDVAEGAGSENAIPPAEATEDLARSDAPRRRSTVREPVGFPLDRGLAASPVSSEEHEPPVESAEERPADGSAEPSTARRTGWWARRIMGNKG
ncbi:MAG: Rne/Rng family ribonuclease [Xanthobacteraceae bacterium]